MFNRRGVLAAGAASLIWPGTALAQAGEARIALTIGVNKYGAGIGELRNAANDAALIRDTLAESCGFSDAVQLTDLSLDAMRNAIETMAGKLKAAGSNAVGFFYFSGHGFSAADGANYVVPHVADPNLRLDGALSDHALPVAWIQKTLADSGAIHIVSIDACRTRVPGGPRLDATASTAIPAFRNVRGLVANAAARPNQFMALAAWEGEPASDGEGEAKNGPYAAALRVELLKGGRRVWDLFDDVRLAVRAGTRNEQEPMNLTLLDETARQLLLRTGDPVEPNAPRPGSPFQALVVGCSYRNTPMVLAGTHQDARRMAAALNDSGFQVDLQFDPDQIRLGLALRNLRRALQAAEGRSPIGVVYFSGFGASLDGQNYFVPDGQLPQDPADLPTATVPFETVIQTLTMAKKATVVVFVDCGRVFRASINPRDVLTAFSDTFGNDEVLVAYNVMPGQRARETPEGSLFSIALAEEIAQPARRDLSQLLQAVRQRVSLLSDGQMTPRFDSTLSAPIHFRDERGLEGSS